MTTRTRTLISRRSTNSNRQAIIPQKSTNNNSNATIISKSDIALLQKSDIATTTKTESLHSKSSSEPKPTSSTPSSITIPSLKDTTKLLQKRHSTPNSILSKKEADKVDKIEKPNDEPILEPVNIPSTSKPKPTSAATVILRKRNNNNNNNNSNNNNTTTTNNNNNNNNTSNNKPPPVQKPILQKAITPPPLQTIPGQRPDEMGPKGWKYRDRPVRQRSASSRVSTMQTRAMLIHNINNNQMHDRDALNSRMQRRRSNSYDLRKVVSVLVID
jgi:hypothetical protein